MIYLEVAHLGIIFGIISKYFTKHEAIPHYYGESEGIRKLLGVFKGVKDDRFYPEILGKATYLLVQINKGHFFSNGNKRAALACTLVFLVLNDYFVKKITKSEYEKKLSLLFLGYQDYQDHEEFLPEEFGYYNLSMIIAESHKYASSFSDLKEKVKDFISFSFASKNVQ